MKQVLAKSHEHYERLKCNFSSSCFPINNICLRSESLEIIELLKKVQHPEVDKIRNKYEHIPDTLINSVFDDINVCLVPNGQLYEAIENLLEDPNDDSQIVIQIDSSTFWFIKKTNILITKATPIMLQKLEKNGIRYSNPLSSDSKQNEPQNENELDGRNYSGLVTPRTSLSHESSRRSSLSAFVVSGERRRGSIVDEPIIQDQANVISSVTTHNGVPRVRLRFDGDLNVLIQKLTGLCEIEGHDNVSKTVRLIFGDQCDLVVGEKLSRANSWSNKRLSKASIQLTPEINYEKNGIYHEVCIKFNNNGLFPPSGFGVIMQHFVRLSQYLRLGLDVELSIRNWIFEDQTNLDAVHGSITRLVEGAESNYVETLMNYPGLMPFLRKRIADVKYDNIRFTAPSHSIGNMSFGENRVDESNEQTHSYNIRGENHAFLPPINCHDFTTNAELKLPISVIFRNFCQKSTDNNPISVKEWSRIRRDALNMWTSVFGPVWDIISLDGIEFTVLLLGIDGCFMTETALNKKYKAMSWTQFNSTKANLICELFDILVIIGPDLSLEDKRKQCPPCWFSPYWLKQSIEAESFVFDEYKPLFHPIRVNGSSELSYDDAVEHNTKENKSIAVKDAILVIVAPENLEWASFVYSLRVSTLFKWKRTIDCEVALSKNNKILKKHFVKRFRAWQDGEKKDELKKIVHIVSLGSIEDKWAKAWQQQYLDFIDINVRDVSWLEECWTKSVFTL